MGGGWDAPIANDRRHESNADDGWGDPPPASTKDRYHDRRDDVPMKDSAMDDRRSRRRDVSRSRSPEQPRRRRSPSRSRSPPPPANRKPAYRRYDDADPPRQETTDYNRGTRDRRDDDRYRREDTRGSSRRDEGRDNRDGIRGRDGYADRDRDRGDRDFGRDREPRRTGGDRDRGGDRGYDRERRDYQDRPSYSRPSGGNRYDPKRENPDPTNVLGVFGLSLGTREEDLDRIFSKFGRLEKVMIVNDRRTNQSRGFGFLTFETVEQATDARNGMNGVEVDGRHIRVDFSVTQKPHDPTPGYYAGKPIRTRSPAHGGSRHSRSRSPADRVSRRRASVSRSRSR